MEIFFGIFERMFSLRYQCPKSALQNTVSSALPHVVNIGCGYNLCHWVTACSADRAYIGCGETATHGSYVRRLES